MTTVDRWSKAFFDDASRDQDFVRLTVVHRSPLCKVVQWRCLVDAPELRRERCVEGFSLCLISDGTFVHHSPGQNSILHPGALILMGPNSPYSTTHPDGVGDRGSRIFLTTEVVLEAMQRLRPEMAEQVMAGQPTTSICVQTPPRRFLRQATLVARWGQGLESDALLFEEAALDLLEVVLKSGPQSSSTSRPVRPTTREQHRHWVEATKVLLARRYAEALPLSEIAYQVHCSPFHLSRIFKSAAGVSLHRYLTRLRLAMGVVRLVEGERDLGHLAFDLGFSCHSHFTNAFRAELGMPPRAARELGIRGSLDRLATPELG